jgi:DNA-binding NtrC family response regulator
MVAEGKFREDLFYRLKVVTINLPSLRERTDDIPLLVEHFLRDISEQKHTPPRKIDPTVMRRFMGYRWPGNVRQLRHTLESMMVLADGDMLTERDLPDEIAEGSMTGVPNKDLPTGMTMEELEKLAIQKALEQSGGKRTRAAESLGISVRTLQRKLRQYQMEGEEPTASDKLSVQ